LGDDGAGSDQLNEADVVLVGVSRSSKTPLSMYLGYLGYKTANVPIVKGIEPPGALFEIDQTKIVGLTIGAERLAEIRGVFPEWDQSIWGPDDTAARGPDGERVRPMRRLRNCNVTTVAPTMPAKA
jgi:hypothetical protein